MRIDASAVIDELKREIFSKGGLSDIPLFGDPSTEAYAQNLLEVINNPPARFRTIQDMQSKSQNWQQMAYVRSNLTGFLFYFVCDGCERHVKHLYRPDMGVLKCRLCHGLRYPKSIR